MQQAHRRTGICALTLLALTAMSAMPLAGAPAGKRAAASPARRIDAGEAAQHAGEEAMVCGVVASARYAPDVAGKPTFLDFGSAYPQAVFTAVIWGVERAHFAQAPERAYERKHVCVTGKIQLHRAKPEIVVKAPEQLVLDKLIQDPQ